MAECLLIVSKEKQLLEGLLIGKDGDIRGSAEVVAEEKKPKVVQKRLFEGGEQLMRRIIGSKKLQGVNP